MLYSAADGGGAYRLPTLLLRYISTRLRTGKIQSGGTCRTNTTMRQCFHNEAKNAEKSCQHGLLRLRTIHHHISQP